MYEGRGNWVQELRVGQIDGAVSGYRGVMSEIVDVGEAESLSVAASRGWRLRLGRKKSKRKGRKGAGSGKT